MGMFLVATVICGVLILLSTAVFYEIIAHMWVKLPKFEGRPRTQILLTMTAVFIAHSCVVWLFGACFYVLAEYAHLGVLKGVDGPDFLQYVYFSGVSYSSLGFGNIDATGALQLLTVVESILGLMCIGWSVAFTYLVTEKYLFHRRKPDRRLADRREP